MIAITRIANWCTQLVGLDDAHHHGLSFTKLIILLFSVAIVVHVVKVTAMTWPLVLLIIGLVCAAFGRPLLLKFLELLAAKWSGTSNDSTNVQVTGNAAEMMRELPNLWRDNESGDPPLEVPK